jgi:hypothetical protein
MVHRYCTQVHRYCTHGAPILSSGTVLVFRYYS